MKKQLWEYVKESGGKCKMCWFEESGKCVKNHKYTDSDVPEAIELCEDYENAYVKIYKLGQRINKHLK